MKTFERLRIFVDKINTGTPNVIDARAQSISRGVHNGVAFANFKAHKFSYLNITSLGTDSVLSGKNVDLHVLTYRHVSPLTWLRFMKNIHTGRSLCQKLRTNLFHKNCLLSRVIGQL